MFFSDIEIEFSSFVAELLIAFRTVVVLSYDIPVFRADGKDRRDSDIRELIVGDDFPDEILAGLSIGEPFSHVQMKNGTSGVFALEFVLLFERFERIVGIAYRKLSGIGIIWCFVGSCLDDIRDLFLILFCESIGSAFCRRSFEVVEISGLFLVSLEDLSHEIEDLYGEFLASI